MSFLLISQQSTLLIQTFCGEKVWRLCVFLAIFSKTKSPRNLLASKKFISREMQEKWDSRNLNWGKKGFFFNIEIPKIKSGKKKKEKTTFEYLFLLDKINAFDVFE